MSAAALVRQARAPFTLYIIAADQHGLGTAYATTNTRHLLNVPAGRMGAFADAIDGFHIWLASEDAALAAQQLDITLPGESGEFAPRALYGAYLNSIWRQLQEIAVQKKCEIKLVPSDAVALRAEPEIAVLTARGDAIAVDRIILATGHEGKPVLSAQSHPHLLQDPWAPDALTDAAQWPSPVVLIGSGLTAIDMVLSLRDKGYRGPIYFVSRNGLLPQPHRPAQSIYAFAPEEIAAQKNLADMRRMLHNALAAHGEWRPVMDALRPHTQLLWQRLTIADQQRFLARLLPFWNVHRHRMAPQIAAAMEAEIAAGTLQQLCSKRTSLRTQDDQLILTVGTTELRPGRILNCTGPELNVARSRNPLIRQLYAAGIVEPHATGLGIAVDPQQRAWGMLHPHLYAVGSLMTGQLLESTAVPELRAQAAAAAQSLLEIR